MANTATLKHNNALRDWKVVVRKNPADANARLQCDLCQKAVKRDAFLKAIEIGEMPSASEGLDVDSIVVEEGYDGMRLHAEMTQDFIDDMIKRFKDGKKIHRKYVFQIVLAVKDVVFKEPTMVETQVGADEKLTVCGDTHGKCGGSLHYHNVKLTRPTRQASSSTCSRSSGSTATRVRRTSTSSTATLSTAARGRRRWRCSCTPTSG